MSIFFFYNILHTALNEWDTSSLVDTVEMFAFATSYNQPMNDWDVSRVRRNDFFGGFSGMFRGATSFNQPLDGWDMSFVSDISNMFWEASSFNQSLCAWESQLDSNFANVDNAFSNTSCPSPGDPDLSANPPGPFCYRCE